MLYCDYFKEYLFNELDSFYIKFNEYKSYVKNNNINFPNQIFLLIEIKFDLIMAQIKNINKDIGFENEIIFRTLIQEIALLNTELDWRSSSYQESIFSNTYNLDSFNLLDVNYNRYGSKYIHKIENYLLDLYSLKKEFKCLISSSGMSAYGIIEGIIKRYLYKKGDNIYIPGYIYFECFEQINNLKELGIKISYGNKDSFSKDYILKYIYKNKPKFVFIDSILNTSDIKIMDLDSILENLNQNYKDEIYIITDITMSGIKNKFHTYKNINLLIYGSGSKYLLNGLDITMMGFIFIKDKFYDYAERQRRNLGAILYDYQALTFPLLGKDFYENRLNEITKDAKLFYYGLIKNNDLNKKFDIYYGGENLNNTGKSFYGSIITINFNNLNYRTKENYKNIINMLIIEAKNEGVPLIEGVSFGFGVTRVSSSDVMSKGELPFLRISIGPSYYNNNKGLIKIFIRVLENI